MKSFKETKIIGIDHGYGNMKTANHCFKTGISTYGSEPLFTADMLTYNGQYYLIGEGHKEFAPDKVKAHRSTRCYCGRTSTDLDKRTKSRI